MPRIFMSYRRSDSISESGRIHDHLEREFGGQSVFKDVDDIQPGFDFRKVLDEEVSKCEVLLAIIGPDWATAVDGEGRLRLQNPDDFVRLEVESGLKREDAVLVIPVLIKNATMPSISQLPESLHELTYRNAVIIRNDPDFNRDMRRLIDYIHRYTKPKSSISRNTIIGGVSVLLVALVLGLLLISALNNPPSDPTVSPTPEDLSTVTVPPHGNTDLAKDLTNQAQDKASNGLYSEAVDLYSQAIEADPTFATAYLGRALVQASGLNSFTDAIPDLEQAIAIDPNYGEAYRYLGRYQYYMENYDDVEANLLRALELNPSDIDARLWLADYYTDFGDYESALEHYDILLEASDSLDIDSLYLIWIRKGDAQNAIGNPDDALESFQTALSIDPDRVEAYADIGNVYIYTGDNESAVEILDTGIDKVSDDPSLFYSRAEANLGLENYSEAYDDFSRVLQLDSSRITAYVGRGQASTAMTDYVSAIADFNQVLVRDNNYGEAYYLRAMALFESENYDSAIEDFSTAIDMNILTNEAYAYRGLAYEQVEDFDAARSDLQTALDYGLRDVDLRYDVLVELAWFDVDDGNNADALELFTQAISLHPDQAAAYEGQADVFSQLAGEAESDSEALNNWISVLDSLTRGINLADDSFQLIFQRGIAYQELGLLEEDESQLELAVADFKQVIEIDPTASDAYTHLAELALSLDSYTVEDALSYAETAYQINDSDAYAIGTLALVYEAMGNIEEARKYYQLAVDNSNDDSEREDYQVQVDRLNE